MGAQPHWENMRYQLDELAKRVKTLEQERSTESSRACDVTTFENKNKTTVNDAIEEDQSTTIINEGTTSSGGLVSWPECMGRRTKLASNVSPRRPGETAKQASSPRSRTTTANRGRSPRSCNELLL